MEIKAKYQVALGFLGTTRGMYSEREASLSDIENYVKHLERENANLRTGLMDALGITNDSNPSQYKIAMTHLGPGEQMFCPEVDSDPLIWTRNHAYPVEDLRFSLSIGGCIARFHAGNIRRYNYGNDEQYMIGRDVYGLVVSFETREKIYSPRIRSRDGEQAEAWIIHEGHRRNNYMPRSQNATPWNPHPSVKKNVPSIFQQKFTP